MIPKPLINWLEVNGHGGVVTSQSIGGGCINNSFRLVAASGQSFFLKTNPNPPTDMFAREAEGLEALSCEGAPRLPKPLLFDEHFILLEDLVPAPPREDYWAVFGRRLAELHGNKASRFGFEHDNYIGLTLQPNTWTDDGHEFFAQQRLLYQAVLANQGGLLTKKTLDQVESLASRLQHLIPSQPASLIHGDLWTGNSLTNHEGEPAIIDPAAHYGWAEAELAMTTLFGSFPPVFYHAYQEIRPLEPGYRDRFGIYNLYHLLNHLNLFGMAYLGQVMEVVERYSLY